MMVARVLRDPCLACGHAEWADTPHGDACASCGAVPRCPDVTEWPRELKRWIIAQVVRRALAQHGGRNDPEAWKRLLTVMLRGQHVPVPVLGTVAIPWAASPDDVYAIALRLAQQASDTDLPMGAEDDQNTTPRTQSESRRTPA
jgi:hypothetical protein